MILTIPLPECWDYKYVPPHLALQTLKILKYGVSVTDTRRANCSINRYRKDTGHDEVTYLRTGRWELASYSKTYQS